MNTPSSPHPIPPSTRPTLWRQLVQASKDIRDVGYVFALAGAILTSAAIFTWERVRIHIYPTWAWGKDDQNYDAWESHKAPSDGLVMASVWLTKSNLWVSATIGTNEPYCSNRGEGSASITFPVHAGNEWRVEFEPADLPKKHYSIRWFPLIRKK